MTNTLKP